MGFKRPEVRIFSLGPDKKPETVEKSMVSGFFFFSHAFAKSSSDE